MVDDLTDTGKTARVVREMLPNAHFATVYAKPAGVPTVDTFITEVSQDTWIYFPWDLGLSYVGPIAKDVDKRQISAVRWPRLRRLILRFRSAPTRSGPRRVPIRISLSGRATQRNCLQQ